MDLVAALGLAFVIEGLMLAVFASALPELVAALQALGARQLRVIGIVTAASGAALYLAIRG